MTTNNPSFIAEAHGRVNLIGEHTDYNGGWVLPTTIPQTTRVTLVPRADKKVIATSSSPNAKASSFMIGEERRDGEWTDYIKGGTLILRTEGFEFDGFDIFVQSTVPMGSGLSSSAALEVSFLKALRAAFNLELTDIQIALFGQRIENEFVGARVGIMDQMACSLAEHNHALFLDTQKLTYENIALPMDLMDLVVINSGVAHRLTDGGYNQRRADCEEACRLLGIQQLRELDVEDLNRLSVLPEINQKRARHVITENERVHRAVAALKDRDLEMLGRLFAESHASMRDDYGVSIPEIDDLVDRCMKNKFVWGARLTGGGFGGSIVAITQKGHAFDVAKDVIDGYNENFPVKATLMAPMPFASVTERQRADLEL